MRQEDLPGLVRSGVIDAEGAALFWLLLEGGVPLVVAGSATTEVRAGVAAALLDAVPERGWMLLDVDTEPASTERLSALVSGGVGLGLTSGARDLRALIEDLTTQGTPEDVVRRLGLVAIVESTAAGTRVVAAHYLRPTERDGQGHVQRRPPAVLTTWDRELDTHEHFAWGVTPELADRIDRAQADLEERQRDRQGFITRVSVGVSWPAAALEYLASEPSRVPAPEHERAKPSVFGGGLTDPDPDPHVH